MNNVKETIMDLLISTKRDGIMSLLTTMKMHGFYEAPCSSEHHLCKEGGLAEHSLNVFRLAEKIVEATGSKVPYESLIIACLLHDLGKMGDFGKPMYIENILKSGDVSKSKPYKINPELMPIEHEIRSVAIASKYINLTEQEEVAILQHNGLYGKLMSGFTHPNDDDELYLILHFADMWCSRISEIEEKGDE